MSACTKCLREVWDGEGAVNIDLCEMLDGATCILTLNQNNLVAAIRAVIKCVIVTPENKQIIRTTLAVVEQIQPSSRSCPLCLRPLVVGLRNIVSIHHTTNADLRPCPASYGTVLGGFLLEKDGK